jgi:DNA-binding response OmpR family regulator
MQMHTLPGENRLEHATFSVGDFEMDSETRTVWRAGQRIRLTRREFELLELLVQHRGQVVRRTMIQQIFYDADPADISNVVDVYINFLRKKIDRGFEKPLILTRRGEGYLFRAE